MSSMKDFSSFLRPHLVSDHTDSGAHPDANLLSAFAERNLSRPERATILKHLSRCPECREILALSSAGGAYRRPSFHRLRTKNINWWALRLAATAALTCLVIATIWGPALFRRTPASAPPQTPIRVSTPSYVPAPSLSSKTIEPAAAKPGARKKKQVSPQQDVTAVRERSLNGALTKLSEQATKSNRFVIVSPERARVASSQAMLAPQTDHAAPAPQSKAVFEPKSTFSPIVGGAVSAQKSVSALQANENTVWRLGVAPKAGTVQKSDDGGRSWLNIPIDQATQFYALSASGSDVWVGGAGGKLFHSVDNGVHWTPAIPVSDEGSNLTEAIIKIDAHGESITLKTASGAIWATEDGGAHWRRQ